MKAIPEFDTDIFSHESVRNANAVDDRLRETAPVVKLPGEDVVMLARFDHVAAGLRDWRSFSSTSRPWHDPKSVRPELLLTDDPECHEQIDQLVQYAKDLYSERENHRVDLLRGKIRMVLGAFRARLENVGYGKRWRDLRLWLVPVVLIQIALYLWLA